MIYLIVYFRRHKMEELKKEIEKNIDYFYEKYVKDYVGWTDEVGDDGKQTIRQLSTTEESFYDDVEEDIYKYLICCLDNYDYDRWE